MLLTKMAVHCTHCGEELLGSVNRCWRCGRPFAGRLETDGQPPQRRRPLENPLETAVSAEIIEGDPNEDELRLHRDFKRRGSPFAETTANEPALARRLIKLGAAVAAVLGLAGAFVAMRYPLGGIAIAAVGIGFGFWGLQSQQRGLAVLALLICCLAFATSGFQSAVGVYTYFYGVSPFAP